MFFTVLDVGAAAPTDTPERAFLVRDNWNDWFEWVTMLTLVVVDADGLRNVVGSVKVGVAGMEPGKIALPQTFDALGDGYFSLGQSDDYYETLSKLEPAIRDRILRGLRDVVSDVALFDSAKNERVMQSSLLRSVSEDKIRGRFSRLVRGDATLTRFRFKYAFSAAGDSVPPTIDFDVVPESSPPTNIHVIIGRNGVGKTRFLQKMTLALLSDGAAVDGLGTFESMEPPNPFAALLGIPKRRAREMFGNVVSVTFSAFDPFEPLNSNDKAEPLALPYSYVGLKGGSKSSLSKAIEVVIARADDSQAGTAPKKPGELADDFVRSVLRCTAGPKAARWSRALDLLEGDPLFKEADVTGLGLVEDPADLEAQARMTYQRLSSGHKIVLLTITRLVETVEEKTLVLVDEPEAHLHPPLLAAFVRAISDLLIQRNGVAIIATHSPVVLQEAPKSCVWILRRSGLEVRADRPESETFGENVGVLTREVFGLEVTKSGFHQMIERLVDDPGATYDAIVEHFNGQVGAEARALIRGLIAQRDADSLAGRS